MKSIKELAVMFEKQRHDNQHVSVKAKDEYKCSLCGGVFSKAWDDKQANEQAQSYWPGIDTKCECDIVCDECWNLVKPENFPEEYQISINKLGQSLTE